MRRSIERHLDNWRLLQTNLKSVDEQRTPVEG
jgi:hypothetical protein